MSTTGYEAEPTDVAAEIAWLDEFTDPLERYTRATAAQAHHEAVVAALGREREKAAAQMHTEGASFAAIGRMIGMTRAWAQKLVERGRKLEEAK